MLENHLLAIQKAYEDTMYAHMAQRERDIKLSSLMTKMEAEFKIPLFYNNKFEENNKIVMVLYRKLSMSRKLSKVE
ncbi:hypothetical protein PP175_14410 [Aneurinibacillus sp. Ricciae_BoGa-3]|uniref:hypothetical protein n=1 Tax=Aneurinibacillus sp. Ricciae_BoGa-3 TaxID=3022697 RepID=UPI00234056E7|nr:hypothetical protein [Aneurinibacillus sp. Ricciae_BoGa-3]WCK52625.1 hypothetical protein PP175_14410 [Aneurinibacillus sp. Ricciae_BoGa-3]